MPSVPDHVVIPNSQKHRRMNFKCIILAHGFRRRHCEAVSLRERQNEYNSGLEDHHDPSVCQDEFYHLLLWEINMYFVL